MTSTQQRGMKLLSNPGDHDLALKHFTVLNDRALAARRAHKVRQWAAEHNLLITSKTYFVLENSPTINDTMGDGQTTTGLCDLEVTIDTLGSEVGHYVPAPRDKHVLDFMRPLAEDVALARFYDRIFHN